MFIQEAKKIVRSIPYLLYVAVIALMFFTQNPFPGTYEEPLPGQDNYGSYGYVYTDDMAQIQERALYYLFYEFTHNEYTTYPVGFYKQERLNAAKKREVAAILAGMIEGFTEESLLDEPPMKAYPGTVVYRPNDEGEMVPVTIDNPFMHTPVEMPYERFAAKMKQIDKILGGGSNYTEDNLRDYGRRPYNYEEAMEQYELFKTQDKYSGGYARRFADYMVIFATIMPVFVAVSEGLRDRIARMREVVWSRGASSQSIVFARFAAIVGLCMIPILLLAAVDTVYVMGMYANGVNPFAFFCASFFWVMPGIMIAAAAGLFITELTDTPAAILILALVWIICLSASKNLIGNYEHSLFTLMPRHNSLSGAATYLRGFRNLAINRAFYAGISVVITGLSSVIFDIKRKGRWYGYDSVKAAIVNRAKRAKA